jgi:hypothetical protein
MAYQGTYAGLAAQKSRGLAVLTPPSPPFRYSYPRDNTFSEVIGLLDNMMVWGRKTRQGRVSINEVGCLNMLVALFFYIFLFFSLAVSLARTWRLSPPCSSELAAPRRGGLTVG